MSAATTINSQTVAEQLNEWTLRNYDPSELSALGASGVVIVNPAIALAGIGIGLAEDSSVLTMFASEAVLGRDWNTAEEDEAWAHL